MIPGLLSCITNKTKKTTENCLKSRENYHHSKVLKNEPVASTWGKKKEADDNLPKVCSVNPLAQVKF